jgi:alpha-beta hydrolase superfamily lysophospholipase
MFDIECGGCRRLPSSSLEQAAGLSSTAVTASTASFGTTRDGLTQRRRHWAAASPKAAILLIHGIGEHSARYEHVGDALSDAGFDTLSFDQRGFGETSGRRAFVADFSEYTDDVADLLAERRELAAPVVLMGHSLGGLIAATYLIGADPQPDLAVLSAPALAAEIPRWQRVAVPVLSRVTPRLHVKSDFDGSILSRDEEVQEAYDNDPLRVDGATASLGRQIMAAMASTSEQIDRITLPTYVLHGGDDALVEPLVSEPIGRLANATRKVWPGLRHECMNEPEWPEVIAGVTTWLDSQLSA